jgi:hypothetical protein
MIRAQGMTMSSREYDGRTRMREAGRLAGERPGRHSVAGRIGRGAKPPPQLGQRLWSSCSTQSAQTMHSELWIRASTEVGQVLVVVVAVAAQLQAHAINHAQDVEALTRPARRREWREQVRLNWTGHWTRNAHARRAAALP